MRVDEKLMNKIQSYLLIGISIATFFIIVNCVFTSGIMRAGERDLSSDKYKEYHHVSSYSAKVMEPAANPIFNEFTYAYHEASPLFYSVVHTNATRNTIMTPIVQATIPSTTQPKTVKAAAATTAPVTKASATTIVTEPTENSTAVSTNVSSTTEPSSTASTVSSSGVTEPTETTADCSTTNPSASTEPSSNTDPSASTTDPSASMEPTESTNSSTGTEPTSSVVPTTEVSSTSATTSQTNANPFKNLIEGFGKLIGLDSSQEDSTNTATTDSSQTQYQTGYSDTTSAAMEITSKSATGNSANSNSSNQVSVTGGAKADTSAIPTGNSSMAVAILVILVSLTSIMFFIRRKDR